MYPINLSADEVVATLLGLSQTEQVCILDSCGVSYMDSHTMFAGITPVHVESISVDDPAQTLERLDDLLNSEFASVFTLSYDFGRKILGFDSLKKAGLSDEPDVFIAQFDNLIVHDYSTAETYVSGNQKNYESLGRLLTANTSPQELPVSKSPATIASNLSEAAYLGTIRNIQERIRAGDTYQTNLTQQFTAELPPDLTPEAIFTRLRRNHPAPFSALIRRQNSSVVSASPERFFRIDGDQISTSPVKGTRRRGQDDHEDERMRADLLASAKDRAENTMIADLLRNDLGQICSYGSVKVDLLCQLETHPTFHHLVTTVSGTLRANLEFSDVLKAVFPCGSITGAPKISTMRIIDKLEPTPRGLSMGAIGLHIPDGHFGVDGFTELSVAIRTMVVTGRVAIFNVGGGITTDSSPDDEYTESLLKATALFNALSA
ncbi:MAG: aminodeoxychorismate synthase component I [Pyrinomonadaceae bacterium]